ncbi:chemotaxis protein CheA [Cohnella pontilimi]|uniref:Chemotaxis protein CheA n=1 Tax=Cohnella pontilimi TaxID=2564100 RepID=A0A4U0FE96_9BACL|nr:chemotaxis protein CheA [Cohnella pontilimi]TJY42604.1 chemotaxis protein CheA [Cohnella pontilimi]
MSFDYREVFIEELEEQLQLMDDEIMKLEQSDSEEVVQSLFRAAHTLKGSSAAMGFEEMKQLTHRMEQLLDQVRSRQRPVTAQLIDLLFLALDNLKLLKEDILRNDPSSTDISLCIEKLQTFAENSEVSRPTAASASDPGESGIAKLRLTMSDRLKVQQIQERGQHVFWVRVSIASDCLIKGARAYVIHSKMLEWGEVLLASPDLENLDESNEFSEITLLYGGTQSSEELSVLVSGLTDVESVNVEPIHPEETTLSQQPPAASEKSAGEEVQQTAKIKSQTIRVSVERLDHLMNLVGELVIDQTRIHQVERTQRRRVSDESVNELGHISDHLSRIIGDLQESVMKARMLPIEQLFNRFPRMIRDLSRDLGKEIDLVIEGQDTELDRTLIEEIADPLIHLIRNAIDHGIEGPDKRADAGKNRTGTLVIRAAHEDNQVVIYVQDDGAGIDPEKIKASAIKKGLVTPEEAEQFSEREAIELIFRPGFSTAAVVSDVSGRGVGMDIVRSNIEKLNGMIDIETKLGEGTCFKIKLPLTLAIIAGLQVKLQKQTLIIPMSNIAEIVRVTSGEIEIVRGQSVILLRNRVIPVVDIHDQFKADRTQQSRIPLVIVGSAEKRLALVVDELIGNQEIVIKSLGSYIGKVEGIAGATILGDGSVALILEISALFNRISGK